MNSTSFPYYFSEKIISIDKIPAILNAFKVQLTPEFFFRSGDQKNEEI